MSSYDTNLHNKNTWNTHENKLPTKSIYIGEVLAIDEEFDTTRIKVRIRESGLDNKVSDADLPYAYPLLDKTQHNLPLVGQGVLIILADVSEPQANRYWISRLIPQLQDIDGRQYLQSTAGLDRGYSGFKKSMYKMPDAKGILPGFKDVALLGKQNADLILSDTKFTLRAGKTEINDKLTLNKKNPAIIDGQLFTEKSDGSDATSFNTMLSDVNLMLSHKDAENYGYDITKDTLKLALEKAYSIPRSEPLIEFLELFLNAFINHVHPYSNIPPVKNTVENNKLLEFDRNKILSKNNKVS